MNEFNGKTAVVTGGASGIGRAMAERFAKAGMNIVIGDVEPAALDKVVAEFRAKGVNATGLRTDVSKEGDVKALADKTVETFGGAHIVCNNAGVGISGFAWEISDEDWRWVMGVNLWGVIYGVRHFVPIMLKGGEGHIVNTASMAGLTTGPGMSPYFVTKHGVVALSEAIHQELTMAQANIGVSVLCPAWVNTRIGESDRNRPGGPIDESTLDPIRQAMQQAIRGALSEGLSPDDVAEMVFQAVINKTFYILPHAHWKDLIQERMENIIGQRTPTLREFRMK